MPTWTCGSAVSTGWSITYDNVQDGECTVNLRVTAYAYRCFDTYIGDNDPNHFYTHIQLKYTYTGRTCEGDGSSSDFPCEDRVEWHNICGQLGPPGTFIKPQIEDWFKDHFEPSSLENLESELCQQIRQFFGYPPQ